MNVLIAADGPASLHALLPYALRFVDAVDADLAVVRVLQPLLDLGNDRSPSVREATEQVAERWRTELQGITGQDARKIGLDAAVVEHGQSVSSALIMLAQSRAVGLLVVRTNNSGGLGRLLFGSTTSAIVKATNIPVMVVGPTAGEAAGEGAYRLVLTTDGSKNSEAAILALPGLLGSSPAEVLIVRVLEQNASSQDERKRALDLLAANMAASLSIRTSILTVQSAGDTGRAIADTASDFRADAILMATHGHGGVRSIVAGSVARDVVARAAMPVVLVRASAG